MKLFDYFLFDHISRRNARRAIREQQRHEESRENVQKGLENTKIMFHRAPIATTLFFASWLAIIYTYFKSYGIACWISLFVLVDSFYTVLHNSVSRGRTIKYYILVALCSLLSFSGIYTIIALKHHDKIGVALIIAGLVAAIAVAVRSSFVYGVHGESAPPSAANDSSSGISRPPQKEAKSPEDKDKNI